MSVETVVHTPKIEIARTMQEALRAKEAVPISEAVGIIMCGGLGERVRDITRGATIKPLIPVGPNQAIIDISVMFMRQAGVGRIIFATNEHGVDALRQHMSRDRLHYDGIEIAVDNDHPKGFLFSLKKLIKEEGITKPIIKASGDEGFASVDVASLYEAHMQNGDGLTCMLTDKPSPNKHKMWIREDGQVTILERKPFSLDIPDGLMETGLYVIDPSQFSEIDRFSTWSEVMKNACENGNLYGHRQSVDFWNVNTPADLARVRSAVARRIIFPSR